jgi:CBS domain-containing protein
MQTAQNILDRKGVDVATVAREMSVLDAAVIMNERRIGSVVVTSGAKVVGIFTERDILCRVVADRKDPATTKVGEVMTSPMACCRRNTALEECRSVMTQKRIRHLPVVEEGRLYGMLSSGDLLSLDVAVKQITIEYLHEYLHGRV